MKRERNSGDRSQNKRAKHHHHRTLLLESTPTHTTTQYSPTSTSVTIGSSSHSVMSRIHHDDNYHITSSSGPTTTNQPFLPLTALNNSILSKCFSFLCQEFLFTSIASLSRRFYQFVHSSECWSTRTFCIFFSKHFDRKGITAQNKFLQLMELNVEFGGIDCKNSASVKTVCQLILESKHFLENSLSTLRISGNSIDGITFDQFSSLLLFPKLEICEINSVVELDPKHAKKSFEDCMKDWNKVKELPFKQLHFRPTFWKLTQEQVETFLKVMIPKLIQLDSFDCNITCIRKTKEESYFFKIRLQSLIFALLKKISVLNLGLSRYVKHSWKSMDDSHHNEKLKFVTLRSARTKDLLIVSNRLLKHCTSLTIEHAPKDLTDELFDQWSKLLVGIDEFQISGCSYAFTSSWLTLISNNMPDLTKMHFSLTSWFGASKDWSNEAARVISVRHLSMSDCHCLPSVEVICKLFPSLETLMINSVAVDINPENRK